MPRLQTLRLCGPFQLQLFKPVRVQIDCNPELRVVDLGYLQLDPAAWGSLHTCQRLEVLTGEGRLPNPLPVFPRLRQLTWRIEEPYQEGPVCHFFQQQYALAPSLELCLSFSYHAGPHFGSPLLSEEYEFPLFRLDIGVSDSSARMPPPPPRSPSPPPCDVQGEANMHRPGGAGVTAATPEMVTALMARHPPKHLSDYCVGGHGVFVSLPPSIVTASIFWAEAVLVDASACARLEWLQLSDVHYDAHQCIVDDALGIDEEDGCKWRTILQPRMPDGVPFRQLTCSCAQSLMVVRNVN